MKDTIAAPVGVGVISCITVLLVLILSVFSCLTLSTARADYALAQRNAETVRSYYEADSEARRLSQGFIQGEEAELETVVPMNEYQGLLVHMLRRPDGVILVRDWRTVLLEEFDDHGQLLPVWSGESS